MARLNPREWWQRRQEEAQQRRDAQDMAQIPVLDLRISEEAGPVEYPTADVLDMESEAVLAAGTPDIPLDFQTRTSDPSRPRTVAAGYDPQRQTLRLKFRPGASLRSPGGAIYDYFDVTPKEWEGVKRTISTGKFLNRQLAAKDYVRIY